jgi:hypothetical protein
MLLQASSDLFTLAPVVLREQHRWWQHQQWNLITMSLKIEQALSGFQQTTQQIYLAVSHSLI